MGFFCIDCYNKLFGLDKTPRQYVFAKERHLCRICGQFKPVILYERLTFRQKQIALWRRVKKFFCK